MKVQDSHIGHDALEMRISQLEYEIDEARRRLRKIEKFIDLTTHGANEITMYREIFDLR